MNSDKIKKIKLLRDIHKYRNLKKQAILSQEYEKAAQYREKEKDSLTEYYNYKIEILKKFITIW